MKRKLLILAFFFFTMVMAGQNPVDYLMKGKALVEQGKSDDAIIILTKALESFRESQIYLGRAEAFIEKGDYSRAINDFNSANDVAPSSGEYGLARIYGLKGDAATSDLLTVRAKRISCSIPHSA